MPRITINGVALEPFVPAYDATLDRSGKAEASARHALLETTEPLGPEQRSALRRAGLTLLEYVPEGAYVVACEPNALERARRLPFVSWAGAYPTHVKLQRAGLSEDETQVDVVLHRDVDARAAAPEIAAAIGGAPASLTVHAGKIRLVLGSTHAEKLALLDCVRHIEAVSIKRLFGAASSGVAAAQAVNHPGSLEGEGEVIAVCDTGLDVGSLSDVHPAFRQRVLRIYALARSSGSDPHGHGTHACSCALGDGASARGQRVRGVAPRAKLVVQSVLDERGGLSLPGHLGELFEPPYQNDGARIHTNAWGDERGCYSEESRETDEFVWRRRDAVVLFAAGVSSPSSLALAKNCIAVACAEPGAPGRDATGTWERPEAALCASSAAVRSAHSRAASRKHTAADDDPLYGNGAGASSAVSLAAGSAAVLREHLRKSRVSPSAALVKALLVNGAVAGHLDLAASISPGKSGFLKYWDEDRALDTGDVQAFEVELTRSCSLMKVTLVWTDPPGEGLQNQLRLSVSSPGAHGLATLGTQRHRAGNVEQLLLGALEPGVVSLAVHALRAAIWPQSFAIVFRAVFAT